VETFHQQKKKKDSKRKYIGGCQKHNEKRWKPQTFFHTRQENGRNQRTGSQEGEEGKKEERVRGLKGVTGTGTRVKRKERERGPFWKEKIRKNSYSQTKGGGKKAMMGREEWLMAIGAYRGGWGYKDSSHRHDENQEKVT